jgi:primosomal protein N' (replication factor Y)
MPIVHVALDVPLNRLFDYQSEDATTDDVGRRVLVPFGHEKKVGVILSLSQQSTIALERLKAVTQIWRDVDPLPKPLLTLLRFASEYYHHPLGPVILNALPPGLRRTVGWVPLKRRRAAASPEPRACPPLNAEQLTAAAAIQAQRHHFHAFLLKGITGSGKTEVYLEAISAAVQEGGQVLVLVPEINLTPALEHRFRERLPGIHLVSLHSHLTEKERVARWLEAQSGQATVILGTRLAVFCPIPRLRLIVVDEEHDPSYKQQEGLRYSARDLSIVRAQIEKIPVVLGSATPSLESWFNAQSSRYHLLSLTRRAQTNATLPAIQLVAPPREVAAQGLSPAALAALGERLTRGEQSLVFINRRGYSPALVCNQCGWVCSCERCSARLVVHLRAREMRCHHCGHHRPIPHHCPTCGNAQLSTAGEGTQKIEARLREQFPQARILRVDSDSLARVNAWAETAAAIAAGEVDILVGTQVLVKGHDFPRITLVVALNVDGALYSNDFRGSERLFAQLVQVAGRAGRAEHPGEVIIQTTFPGHPLFTAIRHHDYEQFATLELEARRMASFPPFIHQAILRASSESEKAVTRFMENALRSAHHSTTEGVLVFDPVPPAMARLAGKTRLQLLVQCSQRSELQSFLSAWQSALFETPESRVNWVLDVDPLEL